MNSVLKRLPKSNFCHCLTHTRRPWRPGTWWIWWMDSQVLWTKRMRSSHLDQRCLPTREITSTTSPWRSSHKSSFETLALHCFVFYLPPCFCLHTSSSGKNQQAALRCWMQAKNSFSSKFTIINVNSKCWIAFSHYNQFDGGSQCGPHSHQCGGLHVAMGPQYRHCRLHPSHHRPWIGSWLLGPHCTCIHGCTRGQHKWKNETGKN